MKTHYDILGLAPTASQDEIKAKYRKLAMQYHPDRGGDQAKFQELQSAYDVIGDVEKRAEYDNPQQQFNGLPPGFEDFFSSFGNFNRPQQQAVRNRTLSINTRISLEDAYYGKELNAKVTLPSGRDQLVEIKIPAGIHSGSTLRLAGLGDDSLPDIPRGDIHLTIEVMPHNSWYRQYDDLNKQVDITCIDAMLGTAVNIVTISGKTLEIKIPAGTQHEQMLAVNGYGMPVSNVPGEFGRLLIHVNMTVPTLLTEEQKTGLAALFR